MPTPFDHPFNTPEIDIKAMSGYLECLKAFQPWSKQRSLTLKKGILMQLR